MKVVAYICFAWVILCIIMGLRDIIKGSIAEGLIFPLVLGGIPAIVGFFCLRQLKKEKERLLQKEQERLLLLEQKRIEEEKAETEKQKQRAEREERRIARIKRDYPDYWQSILDEELEKGMTLEMITEFLGKAENKKQTVTKNKTIDRYNFKPYTNSKKKISYELEVTLEDDVVVGWKNL